MKNKEYDLIWENGNTLGILLKKLKLRPLNLDLHFQFIRLILLVKFLNVLRIMCLLPKLCHIQWISLNRTLVNQTSRLLLPCRNLYTRL